MNKWIHIISAGIFIGWSAIMCFFAFLTWKAAPTPLWNFALYIVIMQTMLFIVFTANAKSSVKDRKRIGAMKNRLWISAINGFILSIFLYAQVYVVEHIENYSVFWLIGVVSLFIIVKKEEPVTIE